MKWFIRFFLSLSLILFGGYGHHLSAQAHQDRISYAGKNNAERSEFISPTLSQHVPGFNITPTSYGKKGDRCEVSDSADEDNEDDEQVSLKKYVAAANYFTTLLNNNSFDYRSRCE